MAREVSFPFFMFIWGDKLLAYTKIHLLAYTKSQCWRIRISLLAYTKSPEKVKASLFWKLLPLQDL